MFLHDTESPIYVRSEKSKELRRLVLKVREDFERLLLHPHEFIGGMSLYNPEDTADTVPKDDDDRRLSDAAATELQQRQASYVVKTVRQHLNLVKKFADDETREKYNKSILRPLSDGIDYIENRVPEEPSAPSKGEAPPKYKRKALPPVPKKMTRDEKIKDILTARPQTKLLTISKALKELGYEGTAISTLAPIVKRIRGEI
jgi:hypothetical protein